MPRINGPLLQALRKGKELTFEQLSEAVDVDRRTLSHYERNSPKAAAVDAVSKLAVFYGKPIEQLLQDDPEGDTTHAPDVHTSALEALA